jgi:hypothetical protein
MAARFPLDLGLQPPLKDLCLSKLEGSGEDALIACGKSLRAPFKFYSLYEWFREFHAQKPAELQPSNYIVFSRTLGGDFKDLAGEMFELKRPYPELYPDMLKTWTCENVMDPNNHHLNALCARFIRQTVQGFVLDDQRMAWAESNKVCIPVVPEGHVMIF